MTKPTDSLSRKASDGAVSAAMDLAVMYHVLMVQGVEPTDEFVNSVRAFRVTFMNFEGGKAPNDESGMAEMMLGVSEHMKESAAMIAADIEMNPKEQEA